MFILCSIPSGLRFWSVNHTEICENSESKLFQNIKFFGEISNNWPKDLLEINACKTLEFSWLLLLIKLQWTNTSSVISN